MSKIGRNAPCPCGSGKKFKKCCLVNRQPATKREKPANTIPSLSREIQALQTKAAAQKESFKTMGVFIFFTTRKGDGWVLEATEMDALQVAADGKVLEVEIIENKETLEISWSHSFTMEEKGVNLTRYSDQSEETIPLCPTEKIKSTISNIRARISPELLRSIHLGEASPV